MKGRGEHSKKGGAGACSIGGLTRVVLFILLSTYSVALSDRLPATGGGGQSPGGERWDGGMCDYVTPVSDTVIVVDDLARLQSVINDATMSTTILVRSGYYDLRQSPYAGSGIGIQIGRSDITIRSETGNRDDVIFDAGGMGTGVGKAFMISDYTTHLDTLWNITLADITIQNASNHLLSVQGEFHPRNVMVHNVHFVNSGEQLIKVNPESLSDPKPVSSGTVACSLLEYETHLDEGWYTQGIDIHGGDHWVVRYNTIRNIRAHPESGRISGFAVLVWSNSVGTVVERNRIIDCDRGISFGDWSHHDAAFLDHTGGVIRNNMILGYSDANPEGSLGSYEGIALANTVNAVVANNTIWSPGDIDRGIDILGSNTRSNRVVNNIISRSIIVRGGASGAANRFEANIEHATAEQFVSVANGNLHLAPGSVAVDAGVMYDEMCADIDGEGVIDGHADIGADERAGRPFSGGPCDGGYDGPPIDPAGLGDLFPPPEAAPPYDLCDCDPLPAPGAGAILDTVGSAYDLQVLLYNLHTNNDNRERTIFLLDGEYFLGDSPFGNIHLYTSNVTIRSLGGDRDRVVFYGNHESDFGFVFDSFGARNIENVTLADLTIRDVAADAISLVAYYSTIDALLLHNIRVVNAGDDAIGTIA